MSLINQVLNDLEKRGASTRVGEATVHVVPLRQGNLRLWLVLAPVSFAVLAATAWLKWGDEIGGGAAVAVHTTQPALISVPLAQPVASAVLAVSPEPVLTAASAAVPLKPLAIPLPVIAAVSPNPAISLGVKQAITVGGKDFSRDAQIVMRTPAGKIWPKFEIVMQDETQIVLGTNFPVTGEWSVAVANASGEVSVPHSFQVKRAALAISAQMQPNPATQKKPEPRAEKMAEARTQTTVMPSTGISKQPTQVTPQQQAENEFRKAYLLMQQGQTTAAISGFEAALKLDAGHLQARQTLVRLLLESRRNAEAEHLLQEGLQYDIKQSSLAMLLARLQVGRNELGQALDTMQKSLPYAAQQADYQAFIAALLQRQKRHQEAIDYYQKAVQLSPQSGVWLMGLGISLRAEQRKDEARAAFNRALEARNLNAELQAFVQQQLKEL